MRKEPDGEPDGKGSELVVTVFNKKTKETITVDGPSDGEFALSIHNNSSDFSLVSMCCSNKFLVDHIVHLTKEYKKEFLIALVLAIATGAFDLSSLQNVSAKSLGLDDDEDSPSTSSFH
jgi:hypothetical protein